jgi:membrane protease YdiL (CAAX protease family)
VKPTRYLLAYLGAVLLGAALLAPWVWQAVQWLAREQGIARSLAGQPFHRYVNRCLLVLALGLLWPLVKSLQLRTWAELGWRWNESERRAWGRAFVLGFLTLGIATALAVVGGGRHWSPPASAGRWLGKLASAAGTALVVSVLEELLFRGAVFSALRRQARFGVAAAVTSALYAWVHFFERPPQPELVDALSGFRTLALMLRGFVDLHALVPGLGSLLLAGAILAVLRERTGGLGASIGLHAGWIFWLKAYGFLTTEVPGADPQVWGTGKLIDGWVAFGLLAVVAIVVQVRPHLIDHESPPPPGRV